MGADGRPQVVYLLGAGASHACVKAIGRRDGILMKDLNQLLADRVNQLLRTEFEGDRRLTALVNELVDESTDYEHLITFLDESVSSVHRTFADSLRRIFEEVLRERLDHVEKESGRTPNGLYEALLDMYEVEGIGEDLRGILTINYDEYLERAIERTFKRVVDFGVDVPGTDAISGKPIRLLKLHGSFGWRDAWPLSRDTSAPPMWIPPGIQKAKDRYPFNVLWGLARELLDCDILRIIGCKLGANDWDLISLLFTTRHAHASRRPYRIEVIDAPLQVRELKKAFPYLDVYSLLEVEPVGSRMISELGGGDPRPSDALAPGELAGIEEVAGWSMNWFRVWLRHMAEALYADLGSVKTPYGHFEALLEAY